MKSLIALASVVAFSAAPAFAAEGQLSRQSLAKMGLPGMTVMSDEDGLGIRGLSASAGGFTISTNQGSNAQSQYFASGPNAAQGSNASFAVHAVNYNFNFIGSIGFSAARTN